MRSYFIFIFIVSCLVAQAQNARTTDGKIFVVNDVCVFNELHGVTSTVMQSIIDEQKNLISASTDQIKSIPCSELSNKCAAYVDENGDRYVLYDPKFVDENGGKKSWAVKGVIAHEIGHHRNRDDLSKTSIVRDQELDADFHAGQTLQAMGASLSQALSYLDIIDVSHDCKGAHFGRHDYPCKKDRVAIITEGYNKQAEVSGQYIDQSLAGPSAALYSVVVPGLGNAFVQEKFRIVDYLLPAAGLGSSIFGFMQYNNSKNSWDDYLVAQSTADIKTLKEQSNSELSKGRIFLGVGAALLIADIFKVYKKGKKNKSQQEKFGLQLNDENLGLSLCYYLD